MRDLGYSNTYYHSSITVLCLMQCFQVQALVCLVVHRVCGIVVTDINCILVFRVVLAISLFSLFFRLQFSNQFSSTPVALFQDITSI